MTSFDSPDPSRRRDDDPEQSRRREGRPAGDAEHHPTGATPEPASDRTTRRVSRTGPEDADIPVHQVRETRPEDMSGRDAARSADESASGATADDAAASTAAAADARGPRREARRERGTTAYRSPATSGADGTDVTGGGAVTAQPQMNWAVPLGLLALAALIATGILGGLLGAKNTNGPLSGSTVHVDDSLPYPVQQRQAVRMTKVSPADARTAALQEVDGTVVSESLETNTGRVAWDVDVYGKDGKLHSVRVDPGNGNILRDDTTTDVNMADVRAAAAAPNNAAAVADRVVDNGRTPTEVVYDPGKRAFDVRSFRGGTPVQQAFSAQTGQSVPQR